MAPKNRFAIGAWLKIIHPSDNRAVRQRGMKNANGEAIDMARRQPAARADPVDGSGDHALSARLSEAAAETAA